MSTNSASAATDLWVDAAAASGGAGSGCGADAAYTTVQAAVTAAVSGDTINVCPGTYVGNIAWTNKANITLKGAKAGVPAGPDALPAGRGGTDESVIVPATASAAITVQGASGGLTIDGLTIQRTDAGAGLNINSPSLVGIEIINNIFRGTTLTGSTGIVTSGFSDMRIANNNVSGFRQGMVLTGQVTNLPSTIEGNFIGAWASGNNGLVLGQNSGPGHTISGNRFAATAGIGINTPPNQIVIADNIIGGTGSTGIFFPGTAPVSGAQVTGNTISGYSTGIWQNAPHALLPVGSPPNEVHLNNIAGNTQYGIQNQAAPGAWDIAATCNWWGSATGPRTTFAGPGDRVTVGNVSYTPWLIAPAPGSDCTGGILAPTAEISASTTAGDAPLPVDFDGSASSDVDGTVVSYAWDFGDGNTAAGVTASHVYTTPGTYTVTLTVTDNSGLTGSAVETIEVTVPNAAPTSVATATPTSGTVPLTVEFDGTGSSDSDGTIVSYDWDFGDGGSASGITATHVYTSVGTFVATLTVTDDEGLTHVSSVVITVNAVPQPQNDNDCKKGNWEQYGFRNQGQCIRYVNTGKDDRIGQ